MSTVGPDSGRHPSGFSNAGTSAPSSSTSSDAAQKTGAKTLNSLACTSSADSASLGERYSIESRSSASSSSSSVKENEPLAANSSSSESLPAQKAEHRLDLQEFGKNWKALKDLNRGEPVFYGRRGNGKFTLECKYREDLRNTLKITDEEMKTGGPFRTESGTFYCLDAKDIAEQLIKNRFNSLR